MDKSVKVTSLPTKLVLNQLLEVWASAPTASSLLSLTRRMPITSLTTMSHHAAVTGSVITVHNRCRVSHSPRAQNNPPGRVREVPTLLTAPKPSLLRCFSSSESFTASSCAKHKSRFNSATV